MIAKKNKVKRPTIDARTGWIEQPADVYRDDISLLGTNGLTVLTDDEIDIALTRLESEIPEVASGLQVKNFDPIGMAMLDEMTQHTTKQRLLLDLITARYHQVNRKGSQRYSRIRKLKKLVNNVKYNRVKSAKWKMERESNE